MTVCYRNTLPAIVACLRVERERESSAGEMATNEPACGIDVGNGPSFKHVLVPRTEAPSISLKRAQSLCDILARTIGASARYPNERKTFVGTVDKVVVVITQSS